MSLKLYTILLSLGTVICWTAWILVLFYLDPETSGAAGMSSFYASLFLALLGTFTLAGFGMRALLARNKLPFKFIGISVRQGALFAILIVVSFLLQGSGLFRWWSAGFLVAGLVVLEAFFLMSTT